MCPYVDALVLFKIIFTEITLLKKANPYEEIVHVHELLCPAVA